MSSPSSPVHCEAVARPQSPGVWVPCLLHLLSAAAEVAGKQTIRCSWAGAGPTWRPSGTVTMLPDSRLWALLLVKVTVPLQEGWALETCVGFPGKRQGEAFREGASH